ncbi:MAG: ParA family protein [Bacteroidota bacterium]
MAVKVAMINMKGGVGKSTLTVNLAWHIAMKTVNPFRVLVVDLDPQFNASQYMLGMQKYEKLVRDESPTIWDVFEQYTTVPGKQSNGAIDPNSVIQNVLSERADGSKIDLIPSRLELASSIKNPINKELILSTFVGDIESDYDLVLFDCPPTESLLTTAAYHCCDHIVIPVKPEYLSSIGLPLLARSLSEFKRQYKKSSLSIAGIVFNHTTEYSPEENIAKREVKSVAAANGWPIYKNGVPYSRSFPKGAREGQPIFRTTYARTTPARKFENFAIEFIKSVGLTW